MDWKQFIQKTAHLTETQELRVEDLEEYLAFCKEKIALFSKVKRFFLRMGLLNTQFGRDLFLQSVFRSLQEHIPFQEAPREAIEAFDRLVSKLFSPLVAKQIDVHLQPKKTSNLFEEIESLRSQVKQFQDLSREISSLYEELRKWRISHGPDEMIQSMESKVARMRQQLKSRQSIQAELLDSYRLLVASAQKLHMRDMDPSWQEHIQMLDQLKKEPFSVPQKFQDERAFTSWCDEQKKDIQHKKQLMQSIEHFIHVDVHLKSLLQALKSCRIPIATVYGKHYARSIEEAIRSGNQEYSQALIQEIEEQKHEALELSRKLNEQYKDLQRRCLPYYEVVYQVDLAMFEDLPKALQEVIEQGLPESILPSGRIRDVRSQIDEAIALFFQKQLLQAKAIGEQGKKRKAIMDAISEFQKVYRDALECCLPYADLHGTRSNMLKEIDALSIDKNLFQSRTADEIETGMQQCQERYQKMKGAACDTLQELMQKCRELEYGKIVATCTIQRRLFEIFSTLSPYADLHARLDALHTYACTQIGRLDDLFYSGHLTLSEYKKRCFELAYDHDIMQLRADLNFRATRLRELRDACHLLLGCVQKAHRFFRLLGLQQNEQLLLLYKEIVQFLHRIENPFQIFASCVEFESVNTMFRSLWIELEGLQARVPAVMQMVDPEIKNHQEMIQRACTRLFDDLEEVLKEENKRPFLVDEFRRRMSQAHDRWQALQNELSHIENIYPFVRPSSLFLSIDHANTRKMYLTQSKEIYEQIHKKTVCAKALQQIKAFEEERIDDILEAFERFGYVEDVSSTQQAYDVYLHRMRKSSELVAEEVLLDVGLLDAKAILDRDDKKLKYAVLLALETAQSLFQSLIVQLKESPETGFFKSVYQDLLYKIQDVQKRQMDEQQMDALFERGALVEQLARCCHLLFQAKMLLGSRHDNPIAKRNLFISAVRLKLQEIEAYIQQERKKTASFLVDPWIEECHAARRTIEKLELATEKSAIQAIIEQFCSQLLSIPEMKRHMIDACKQELLQELDRISSIPKQNYFAFPLYAIPGYLDYFKGLNT